MTLDHTLASALAPLRKIAQVFTLPSGVWFTSIATLATKQKLFFSLLNARTVGCRPVTLLAYSLSFCTNWWTHIHTHTCTRTCIYHRQNWLHAPIQGVSQQEVIRLVVQLAVGTTALSPHLHGSLSALGYSSMGLQDP